MIEVNAVFNKERVKKLSLGKRIGNMILFPIICAALVAGGTIALVRGTESVSQLIIAIVVLVMGPALLVLMGFLIRSDLKAEYKVFGVDEGETVMNFKFADKGFYVSLAAGGEKEKEAISYKSLYKVKRTRACFMFYISKEEIFYVPCDCFVSGTPDDLFKLLYGNKVILDY